MSRPSHASRRAFRRGISLASCAFLLTVALSAADFGSETDQGRRQALLIGNSAYQKNALPNPVNDAKDFGAMLKEAGFETMVRTDLDLRGMEMAIREFSAGLGQGDTILVFYAGHGVESGGINYLIPVDNAGLESEADLKYKAYAASRILDEAAAKKAGLVMLILDACRDNPFPSRSGAGSRGLTVMAGPPQLESLILYSTAPGTTAADGFGRG
ncbi:MAG: caspase family protein [Spirochaetes bacterium]|nr:caspase family protein [Spirochaetota bacterium]